MESWIECTQSGAKFSDCRRYRYSLWRRFADPSHEYPCELSQMVAFIGLNPSTADETQDDPTIRRCIVFAKSWNYSGMIMLNLFAFRATDPRDMKKCASPFGRDNLQAIKWVIERVSRTVCCWGNHGLHANQADKLMFEIGHHSLMCFGITKEKQPKHPLYLAADAALEPFKRK